MRSPARISCAGDAPRPLGTPSPSPPRETSGACRRGACRAFLTRRAGRIVLVRAGAAYGGLGRDAGGRRAAPARRARIPRGPPRVSCTGRRGVRFREPRRRGAFILVKRRLEAGMPRTNWLLAAAVVLPLLVPPSAVAHPPGLDGHGDQLREGLWGGGVQGGLRSGGGDGARGRPPPPGYGRPRARAALVREHAHDPRRGRRRGGTASPSPWCPPPG